MWTDDALAELQGCLEASDMSIFKEAIDNIHEYADTVRTILTGVPPCASLPRLSVYILSRSPDSMRTHLTKSETGAQLSSQETPGSTDRPDTSSREPPRLPREHPQRPESCYRENNTRSMWQGIKSVTNYKKDAGRTVIQNAPPRQQP